MRLVDRAAVTVLVLALAIVAGAMFVPPPAPKPAPTPIPVTGVGYREGVLGHPSSINPLTARSQADRDLVALLFRGLVHLGPDGTLQPDLAIAWTASTDGRTYTFTIRRDAAWGDGEPLTADDVAFTVGLVQSPSYNGPLGTSWRNIKVAVLDPYRIRFELPLPAAGFLQMATLPVLPEHLLRSTPIEALADSGFSQQPLGSGPFRLVSLDSKGARLLRIRSVPPAGGLLPSAGPTETASGSDGLVLRDTVEEMELRFYDSAELMAADFQAGRLDAAGGLPASLVETVRATAGARVVAYPRSVLTAVFVNQRPDHPTFRSPDARRGLLAAIDRDGLVTAELGGRATRAEIPIPQSSWAYDATSVVRVGYDRTAAEAALTKAGLTLRSGSWYANAKASSPLTVRLLAPDAVTNPTAYGTAESVARDWQAIGLAVTLDARPAADYVAALSGGQFDAAVADVEIGLDPDLTPLLLSTQAGASGTNVSGVQDTDLDKLLLAARGAVDTTARKKALGELEKYLSEQQPVLPLYFRDYLFVLSGRVRGPSTHEIADPSGRYWDVLDWRLASDG